MSIGMKLGMLGASGAGGGGETRLVGLGNQTAGNSDYWSTGTYGDGGAAITNYSNFGQRLKALMCTFYLDSLAQDFIIAKSNYLYTSFLTIKADGSIVFQLDPRVSGDITWTTAAGTIETGKNYMLVAQCSGFDSNILSNTSMYLGTGGTITNLTSGMSHGDGIANPGGSGESYPGYAHATNNYNHSYESGTLSMGIVGSISAIHFWTGGILTEAGITALYNNGTPLTDPSSDSGNYSSTMAGYYYDGGDFTHLSAGAIATSYEFNDFASPANFRYFSGGPEPTVATAGNGFSIIHP
jgi:hypothetical protein